MAGLIHGKCMLCLYMSSTKCLSLTMCAITISSLRSIFALSGLARSRRAVPTDALQARLATRRILQSHETQQAGQMLAVAELPIGPIPGVCAVFLQSRCAVALRR